MSGRSRHLKALLLQTSNSVTSTAALLLTLSMIFCSCGTGIALEPNGHDVLDLLQGLNASSHHQSMPGTRLSLDPANGKPTLWLEEKNRHISLPESTVVQAVRLLHESNEITFMCRLLQDEGDSGTLIALTSNATRSLLLELESSGRRNELRLHYRHQGQVRVETFHYRLADGEWHKLSLTLKGSQVSVYVDCNRIYRRDIPSLDRPQNTGSLSLFVGQRNRHQALFQGALQDVRIVAQRNGHLLQCQDEESDCDTCAEYQDLKRRMGEVSSKYKQVTTQLAEERQKTRQPCHCANHCHVNGTTREEGEMWKKDRCHNCTCRNGSVECQKRECPKLNCQNPKTVTGDCCPSCPSQQSCNHRGQYYAHGEGYSPRSCTYCRCEDGRIKCDNSQVCPELNCSEKIHIHGQCCPVCNDTDFCKALNITCHPEASCVSLATKPMCVCNSGYQGDGLDCRDINECLVRGGKHGHHCTGNTTCTNTPGSYRCDCIRGTARVDSHDCKAEVQCPHGAHQCHTQADCVSVNGGRICQCKEGYVGNGFNCEPYCHEGCQNGGQCQAPNTCKCRHGYIGANCELDIDECALNISKCHGHSECVNLPGWYHCDCTQGYHSVVLDNHYGSMCWDIDECQGEGDGHTCNPSMECVNTDGGYKCVCPNPGSCQESCLFEGEEHASGTQWKSRVDRCSHCLCEAGQTMCHIDPCDCRNPNVDLACCPSCDRGGVCEHHEVEKVTLYNNGDIWADGCQTCECLNGEVDCWPLYCPPLTCPNAIQRPGDCCPVCEDSNLCAAEEIGGQDLSQTSCGYQGEEYSHGEEWTLATDQCITCQCKAGHICCSFSQTCSIPYARG